jgi:hypothetical protein
MSRAQRSAYSAYCRHLAFSEICLSNELLLIMSFLFGRHRSQSDAAIVHDEPDTLKPSLSHRRIPSGRHQDDCARGGFRGLFRRNSSSVSPLNIPVRASIIYKTIGPFA